MAKAKKKEDPKDVENNSHEEYTPESEDTPKKRWEIPLVWHPSFFDIMDELETDAEKVNFVNAIKWYNRFKELPENTLYVVRVAMKGIMPIIDKNRSKYIAQVKNGLKGGRPKKEENEETQENPIKPNETINKDINNDINKDINKDINNDINKDINKDINNDINKDINNDINYCVNTHKEKEKEKEIVCVVEQEEKYKSYPCHLNRVYRDFAGECSDCKKRNACKLKDISDLWKEDPKKAARINLGKDSVYNESEKLAKATWVKKGD